MERPGIIKRSPAHFVVDEIPAYEPAGEGAHLFLRFRKTNLTTDEAVRAIARALGVERRDVGVAGLKDKVAVTTQWISVPAFDGCEERVGALALAGIEVLEQRRHGNKLKTGHLRGNRFVIVVRDLAAADVDRARAALDRIGREGVPNAFGAQRFGREQDTHERARAWLTGTERAPRDPRERRFQFSAFQSAIFNEVLDHRVATGTWNVPLLGDLLKKEDTGGLFVCTDVQLDRERAERGEVCPTGPIVGDRMRQPAADALELEQRIVAPRIEGIDLHRARALGEGTRRALRLRVTELSHDLHGSSHDGASMSGDKPTEAVNVASGDPLNPRAQGSAIEVRFVLPKGAYATTVLSHAFSVVDAAREERDAKLTEEE